MSTLTLKLTDKEDGPVLRGQIYNGQHVYSVYDFINVVCEKGRDNAYGRINFYRLIADGGEHRQQMLSLCVHVPMSGPGERETPCMTVRGLTILVNILGGQVSAAFREEALKILHKFMDSDNTATRMMEEVGAEASFAKFSGQGSDRGSEASATVMPKVTYVYASSSDAFPNLLFLGRSADLKARPSSRYVAVAPTLDNVRDEAVCHAFFSSKRRKGEFFDVAVEEVNAFFITHILPQFQADLATHMDHVMMMTQRPAQDALPQPLFKDRGSAAEKGELNDVLFEFDVAERRQKLEEARRLKMMEHVHLLVDCIQHIKTNRNIDEVTKVQMEDLVKNAVLKPLS